MPLETLSLGERIRLAARLAVIEHVRGEIERLRQSDGDHPPTILDPVPAEEPRRVVTRRAERPAA